MAVLWAVKSKKIANVFVCILFGYDSNVFQSLLFSKLSKKYFVKKIKDLACYFFNAHALIDKGFIVLSLSVSLSKFLTKINSKLLSLEDLFLILSVWVPFINTHLLITRSRSPDKVKVNYQGHIPENWLYLVF